MTASVLAPSTFTPTPPAAEVEWLNRPEDAEAHAFLTTNGAGWMRSRCKRVHLSAGLKVAEADLTRCRDCVDLVEGTESEQRLLHGDR